MLKKIKSLVKNHPAPVAHAHCDGPCGIYDPSSARIAAEAALSMTKKLAALKPPAGNDAQAWADYLTTFSRFTAIKEEQAHLAKTELLVLWTDYFKPPHLERNPRIHEIFWKAAKQCSEVKVHVDVAAAEKLLEMIKEIPHFFKELNPEIALVGGISLAIMFLWPWMKKLHAIFKAIPAPMIVLLVAVPLGMVFDLSHTHIYTYHGEKYQVGEDYLVTMPDRVFGMFDDITYPDFSALKQPVAWKWVFMFFVIGSLESLLSAKAIDLLDPWKRKTNLNRDMIAVGAGNVACAMVGGLPMISEIVRSKANIDNGAHTRFADLWHGIFLLLCVALIPTILHLIPLAALAAMLVYTGFRLAHPTEFLHVLKIGKEQLLIFVITLVAVLATDLLIGIAIGIAVKLLIHVMNGVPLRSLFKPYLDVENQGADTVLITARY